MKNTIIISILFLFSATLLIADDNYLLITIDTTIIASDPDESGKNLTMWAQEQGGYFTHLSTDLVVLRFPWEKTSDFRSYLVESSDDVFNYYSDASDLRDSILLQKSGIEARTEILKKNINLLNKSDFSGTLYLEQEILRLMSEIETLKGAQRKAENDRKMAQVLIRINFSSYSLPQNVASSFQWINTMNFSQFIEGSFTGKAKGWSYKLEEPLGFALVDNRKRFRAISPEGIRFQIRKEKNYPLKDLKFWSSALVNHMSDTGYSRKNEGIEIETDLGSKIFLIEWGLAFGNNDYLYMTGIIPKGNKIYIIEIAGEIGAIGEYRDVIIDSLKSFDP